MSKTPQGFIKGRIYQVLLEHGPMTYGMLVEYAPGLTVANIKECVTYDKRHNAPERNTFRVVGYHQNLGKGGDLSPIIGLGAGLDAPKPEVDKVRDASRRACERAKVQRAHRENPEEAAVEIAKVRYQQAQATNADPGSRVFASMFAAPPVPPPMKVTRRIYKTRGG